MQQDIRLFGIELRHDRSVRHIVDQDDSIGDGASAVTAHTARLRKKDYRLMKGLSSFMLRT